MDNRLYSKVAQNCSSFFPRIDVFRSCPEASVPTCYNCNNFEDNKCKKGIFDAIAANLK